MRPLARVVWSEGMHLAQHHFQAQNRYFEESIDFAVSRVGYQRYGLMGLELDAEALRNGTVSLIHARGVLPDGLPFQIPASDPPPPSRDIKEVFSPTQDQHVLHLTVPAFRDGEANCSLNGDTGAVRYRAETLTLLDETTGRDEKEVMVSRKNFGLALDSELDETTVSMPIARIKRDGAGFFVYDPTFVPPCLHVRASTRIMDILQRLVELLGAKGEAFAEDRAEPESSVAEYGPREVAGFWLLHAIHQSLAPLRHYRESGRAHPEQVYTELARLAGALCTFSLGSDVRDVPLYRHENLTECFNALDLHIRRHLEITLPTTCVTVPLQRHEKYVFLHSAVLQDARCFSPEAQWVLGARADTGPTALIRGVQQLVKLSSKRDIASLVKEGTAGLPLHHLPSPPSELAPRIGSEYFEVRRSGPLWRTLAEEREVGAYVPEALPNARLELVVILEGQPA